MFKSLVKLRLAAVLVAVLGVLPWLSAQAAMAPASTLIGNQASMSFTDAEGKRRTVDSNRVDVFVQAVYAIRISADGTLEGAADGDVYFPHTIENLGNAEDSVTITLADLVDDDFDFDSIQVFLDDGSGNPGAEITGAVTIAAGESLKVIVVANIPSGQAPSNSGQLTITAASDNDGAATGTNTDTATVTANAVIRVSKQFSADSADPGATETVTLTIENLSGTASGAVTITDLLDDSLVYVGDSGQWSEDPAALDDDTGANDPAGIDYSVAGNEVSITITTVPGNDIQTVSFDVTVGSAAAAGPVANSVDYEYDDGTGNPVGPNTSNEVELDVNQVAIVDASDDNGNGTQSSTDEDAAADDVVTINVAGQGSTILFDDIITNNGNGDDVFNITFDATAFPPGSVVRLLQGDGATPLIDTDGDGTPDTGTLGAGVAVSIFVEVVLPNGVSGNNGGAGWSLITTATSQFNDGETDSVTNLLGTISGATVDITVNQSVAGGANSDNGLGQGPEANAVATQTATAGESTVFNLYVNNTDGTDDNYSLNENGLPQGWTVTYYEDTNGNGVFDPGTDQPLAGGKTGVIPAGEDLLVFAEVGVPEGTDPGNNPFSFEATSGETAATDEVTVAVDVAATRDVDIAPDDQSGTVFPGGSEVYAHQITNNGNIDEELDLDITNSAPGWTTTVYIDVDGDGKVSPGDIEIDPNDPLDIPAGETVNILVEVQAPADGEQGDQNITTIGGTYNNGNSTMDPATITTTITSGDADLDKRQAADTDCDGQADGPFTDEQIALEPGQCAIYEITATAIDADLTDVVISDAIPDFTTYYTCGGNCAAAVSPSPAVVTNQPADGDRGNVRAESTLLTRGGQITLTFSVRLDDERP